jgi:hypothetical protein
MFAAMLCLGAAFASTASGETVTIGPGALSGNTTSVACVGGGPAHRRLRS